jgi:hypothetical protein
MTLPRTPTTTLPWRNLRDLAGDDHQALEHAIRACLARQASLATRHRAVEVLARVRSEDP